MIDVLLATYNGELYLREQIDSVLAQSHADLRILARDDGSTDRTTQILAEYAARHPARFVVLRSGVPTGSAKLNFLELLRASTAPYIAFADQDDVWLPEKLTLSFRAMRQLEATHLPGEALLVFTDLRVVDASLKTRHESFWQHQPIDPENITRLNRLLAQNVVTGCTAVINRPLATLAAHMPHDVHMHDWWMALLANAFGAAQAVREPTVLYRQHAHNVLGASPERAARGLPDFHDHTERAKPWRESVRMARSLLDAYDDRLTQEQCATARAFITCDRSTSRWRRVLTWLVYRLFLTGGLRANLALLWYLYDRGAESEKSTN